MTHYTLADVEMADRHIAEGEHLIVRQEELVSRLEVQGHSTGEAEKLLALLNSTQAEHHVHRAAIVAALEARASLNNPAARLRFRAGIDQD